MPNHVENFIIPLLYLLIIYYVTFKPKSVTKLTLFLLKVCVLLCSAETAVILMCLTGSNFALQEMEATPITNTHHQHRTRH